MPRLIDYLESAAADNTGTSQMDRLLAENYIDYEQFYQDSPETDYGKPYKYKKDEDDESSMSVPLNIRHYADIIKKADVSRTLKEADVGPFSAAKYLESVSGVSVEDLEDSLLSRMERGDVPGGLVAYHEPSKKYESVDDALHKGPASGYYTQAKDTSTAPDTLKLFDNWDTYMAMLHEPLHGLRFPYKGEETRLGHTRNPPFNQASYKKFENEMTQNLIDSYGYPVSRGELYNLVARNKGGEPPKGETYATDTLDRLLQGKQSGGPIEFETAAQDETAHTNMDRLIAEYGQSQEPQYSMRELQEPYDPAREIAEGAFMPIGARLSRVSLIKKLKGERKFDIEKARNALRYIKDWKTLFKKGKEPDTRGGWGKLTSEAMYHPSASKREKKIVDELEHGDWDLIDKFQTGGEVSQSPYDFLETAQPDETAHTNMDRLIAEYGQGQEPQYSMREYQEPYDPAMAIAEGSFMPVGAGLRIMKGSPYWSTVKNLMGKSSNRYKKKWEVYEDAARKFGKEVDRGGSDKAAEQYLTSKWIERVLE